MHTQLPVPLQVCPVGQGAHAAPPAPHELLDSPEYSSHVPELQQPLVHWVPPHEQEPAVHVSPLPQEPHARPPVPHWLADWLACRTQSPAALQQPVAQAAGVHSHWPVVLQLLPVAQGSHAAPPVPHDVED